MRICYLANSAIPSTNASSIQIVKMCEGFSKLNHKVLLITTNASDKKVFDFYNVNYKFKITKLKKFQTFPLGLNYYLFSIKSIMESLKFNPDIYITRNFFTSFLLTILRKRNILELHHGIEIESRIVRFIIKYTNFLNFKYLIRLVAITNSVKNYYKENFKIKTKKIIVSPSGSSIEKVFFNNYIKNNKKLNIGYFGSLYKSRGVDIILKLSKIDKDNRYFIFGNLNQNKNIRVKNFNRNLFNKFRKIQINLDYKKKKSHYIIKNNFTKKPVKESINRILNEVL